MPRPDRPRSRRAALVAGGALALVVVVALVTSTLVGGGGDEPGGTPQDPTPSATGTPLAEVDTTTVAVAREGFCDAVAPEALARALGTDEDGRVRATSWANGERARLEPGLRDVAHEHGCSWRAPDGTLARAWVFAPPVTRQEARDLARAARGADGCAEVAQAPRFGSRSVTVDCRDDTSRERSFRGLFGDAWLTCSLRTRTDDAAAEPADRDLLAEQASTWCAAVLEAAAVPTDAG